MNENTVREVWNELTPFDSLRERSFKFPVSESEYCRFVHFLEKKRLTFSICYVENIYGLEIVLGNDIIQHLNRWEIVHSPLFHWKTESI